MLYLASNTRPDIYFAVHQCAWFIHNTKESHETAVKRICWYLNVTKDEVMVFNPSKKMVVYCYTDAYFAGLWVHENTQDPICDRSSTGLVVPFPIVLCCWCKKFRHRFLSLLYILSIWNFLIMLYNYFP